MGSVNAQLNLWDIPCQQVQGFAQYPMENNENNWKINMTSKLQFQDITIGTGKNYRRRAWGADYCALHEGYLPNGTVFDSASHTAGNRLKP
ncbi:MAG: hypothetical protein U1E91_01610 [Moraxella sp.]